MFELLLTVVYVGCMLPLGLHEEWLERGHPRFVLGWSIAAVGTIAALGLMVLL